MLIIICPVYTSLFPRKMQGGTHEEAEEEKEKQQNKRKRQKKWQKTGEVKEEETKEELITVYSCTFATFVYFT